MSDEQYGSDQEPSGPSIKDLAELLAKKDKIKSFADLDSEKKRDYHLQADKLIKQHGSVQAAGEAVNAVKKG